MSALAGAEIIREFVPASPFAAHLGLVVQDLSEDTAHLVLPDRAELATMGTTVHGGAIATLLDTAAMAAAWSTPTPPESLRGSTATLTISYLAPATGEVEGHARVLRRGRSLVTVDAEATCGGEQVARALVTYKLG